MKTATKISSLKHIVSLCALALGIASVAACPIARADDDPFALETGHWMSFDHYKDATKRGLLPTTPPVAETSATPETQAPQALPATPAATASATPAVAAPSRPLDLPPMPRLNKGFNVKITSTEDEIPAPVLATGATPDIHLSEKNWQNPVTISHIQNAQGNDDETPPLDVRMTYLPDSKVTPVPTPDYISAHHLARVAVEKGLIAKKTDNKTPAEAATCAAIDAYKKQQLDAIQSDRQTLKALQDAISSLGLQKQLGFMTGSDSALNASAKQSQINMDLPVSTSVQ